eukprot:6165793-Pyramimonas_sp.AAC.1
MHSGVGQILHRRPSRLLTTCRQPCVRCHDPKRRLAAAPRCAEHVRSLVIVGPLGSLGAPSPAET